MKRFGKDLAAAVLRAAAGQQDPKPEARRNAKAADYFRRLEPPLDLIDRNELDNDPAADPPPPPRRPPVALVPANKRPDRTLPSRLGMAARTDNRARRLFTPAGHADSSGQVVLPGFGAHITMPTSALPFLGKTRRPARAVCGAWCTYPTSHAGRALWTTTYVCSWTCRRVRTMAQSSVQTLSNGGCERQRRTGR